MKRTNLGIRFLGACCVHGDSEKTRATQQKSTVMNLDEAGPHDAPVDVESTRVFK